MARTLSVGLATRYYDPFGYMLLRYDRINSRVGDLERRVNRVATLDGDSYTRDTGFSHQDRTIELVFLHLTRAETENLARMVRLYSAWTVALPDGAFLCTPQYFRPAGGKLHLKLLITGQ